jgi:(p)ppGpp synthase/HD superfamily hydrolase
VKSNTFNRWAYVLKCRCLACTASMSTFESAISIAAEALAGQTDKAGGAYILHPLRVMLRVSMVVGADPR